MSKATKRGGEAFAAMERADNHSIADAAVERDLLKVAELIDGHRPVLCECGHETVGEHNYAVTRIAVTRNLPL